MILYNFHVIDETCSPKYSWALAYPPAERRGAQKPSEFFCVLHFACCAVIYACCTVACTQGRPCPGVEYYVQRLIATEQPDESREQTQTEDQWLLFKVWHSFICIHFWTHSIKFNCSYTRDMVQLLSFVIRTIIVFETWVSIFEYWGWAFRDRIQHWQPGVCACVCVSSPKCPVTYPHSPQLHTQCEHSNMFCLTTEREREC